MTDTVKGAGRRRAAARSKKVEANEQKLAELKRKQAVEDRAVKAVPRRNGKTTASAKALQHNDGDFHQKVSDFAAAAVKAGWSVVLDKKEDDSEHVTATRGDEVLHIFWLNGVYQKWATLRSPAGEQRVPNAKSGLRVLERSEAEARSAAKKKSENKARSAPRRTKMAAKVGSSIPADEFNQETLEQRVKRLVAERSVPWDQESSEDEIMEMLDGRSISWVSKLTGTIKGARIPKGSKHTQIGYGADGPYITFASMDGPFQSVSLSRILTVS